MLVMVDFCLDCRAYITAGLTECATCDPRSKPLVQLKEVNPDQLTPRPFRVCLMVRGDDENGRLQTPKIAWNRVAMAQFLEKHRKVRKVNYPGLPSHPKHGVAKKQMPGGYGGVLSFEVEGGLEAVARVLPRLKYAYMAANLAAKLIQ